MKYVCYTWLLFLLFSCKNQAKELQENKDDQEVLTGSFGDVQVSVSLIPIIDSLVNYSVVEDEAIGFAGEKSEVYKHFEELLNHATDEELVKLTNHKIPSIRAYAFWGLAKKRNSMVKELIMKHLDDTIRFSFMSGCSIREVPVNTFFLQILTPNYIDNDCLKLKKSEILEVQSKIEG